MVLLTSSISENVRGNEVVLFVVGNSINSLPTASLREVLLPQLAPGLKGASHSTSWGMCHACGRFGTIRIGTGGLCARRFSPRP